MYTKYAFDAAKKKNFQLLERSNDFWSLVEAKEDELKELDKMEETFLLEKRISRKVLKNHMLLMNLLFSVYDLHSF